MEAYGVKTGGPKLQSQDILSYRRAERILPTQRLRTSEKCGLGQIDPQNKHAAIIIQRGPVVYRAAHRRRVAHERVRFPLGKIKLGWLTAVDAQ